MFGKNKIFFPLEATLLKYLFEAVVPEVSECLKKQLAAIKKIQRLNNNKEIDLYYKPTINSFEAFENRIMPYVGEYKLATIRFEILNINMEVDFWLVNGILFSLNFSSSPREYLKEDIIKVHQVLLCKNNDKYFEVINKAVDLLKKFNKLSFENWKIFEISDVAMVRFGKDEYCIFAKHNTDPEFLLVRGDDNETIYFMDHEDIQPKPLE